jgi:hypothetical protein
MESYCIYKVFRPSAKTGASLRIYAECCPRREEAMRRAREIYARACVEVEAVEVVTLGGRRSGVVHRVGDAERAAS